MENTLTVKEAIEQGYELFGYSGMESQNLRKISEISESDFNNSEYGCPVVAKKEPDYLNIDLKELQNLVIEHIVDNSETCDDTDAVPNDLEKSVDWKGFCANINNTLKKHPYWYLTEIKLIP